MVDMIHLRQNLGITILSSSCKSRSLLILMGINNSLCLCLSLSLLCLVGKATNHLWVIWRILSRLTSTLIWWRINLSRLYQAYWIWSELTYACSNTLSMMEMSHVDWLTSAISSLSWSCLILTSLLLVLIVLSVLNMISELLSIHTYQVVTWACHSAHSYSSKSICCCLCCSLLCGYVLLMLKLCCRSKLTILLLACNWNLSWVHWC